MINTYIPEGSDLKFYSVNDDIWGYTPQDIPENGVLKTKTQYLEWVHTQNDIIQLGAPAKE